MDIAHSPLTVSNTLSSQLKAFIILLVMLLAARTAVFLKPTQRMAEQQTQINLETMIPKQFGQWKEDESQVHLLVSPEKQAFINKIYAQTLTRTYVNKKGEAIMLSIAYGGDQSRGLQVHKPETCYAVQGFKVKSLGDSPFIFNNLQIKARRLIATQGNRYEPITYWMRVGNTTVYGGLGQMINRYKMGLKGYIPDGLLFRVSSIDSDNDQAFRKQAQFINALLQAVEPSDRPKLIGITSSND